MPQSGSNPRTPPRTTKLTTTRVRSLEPEAKQYKVWDTEIKGFLVRVMPSGTKTFYLYYRVNGRDNDYKLGRWGHITADQARTLAKEKAAVDLWLREAAPSTALRQWYGHDPEKWPEFKRRYFAELERHPEILAPLKNRGRRKVTLLFSSREERFNNAAALKEYLER